MFGVSLEQQAKSHFDQNNLPFYVLIRVKKNNCEQKTYKPTMADQSDAGSFLGLWLRSGE